VHKLDNKSVYILMMHGANMKFTAKCLDLKVVTIGLYTFIKQLNNYTLVMLVKFEISV